LLLSLHNRIYFLFFVFILSPSRSTLFPYTTLFRSFMGSDCTRGIGPGGNVCISPGQCTDQCAFPGIYLAHYSDTVVDRALDILMESLDQRMSSAHDAHLFN